MTDPKPRGPVLRPVYMKLYNSETGETVPFTGKCLDCKAPTEEGHYHCGACEDRYIEKNKPTVRQLAEQAAREQKWVDDGVLWMYNAGEPRRFQHSCMGRNEISATTMGTMERKGLVKGTGYRGVIELTEKGLQEGRRLTG